MCSKVHSALTAPLVLHHTRTYKCAMKKFGFNSQMQNEPFLIVVRLLRSPFVAKEAASAKRR